MNRILVILDPGSTHEGQFPAMDALIHVAASAGADVIKFQWCSNPAKLCQRRHVPDDGKAYRHIAFPAEWLPTLWKRCCIAGLEFMCTVYLQEDIPVIAPLVQRFKVASFEAGDTGFVNALLACDTKKPVYASCGMGQPCPLGTYGLHCVSAYPAPITQLNLLRLRFSNVHGFSDHSGNVHVGGLAVAAGARIIETHFRLDDCSPDNPDYTHSLAPAKLREYIRFIYFAEQALGDGKQWCMPSEKANLKYRAGIEICSAF